MQNATRICSLNKLTVFMLFLAIMILPTQLSALEKVQNGSFTSNVSGWTPITPYENDLLETFTRDATDLCFRGKRNPSDTGPNFDGYIVQTIALASAANMIVSTKYGATATADIKKTNTWSMQLTGTVACSVATETFLYFTAIGSTTTTTGWVQSPGFEASLNGGYSYTLRLLMKMTAEKSNPDYQQIDVDNVSCNISPSGLVAIEQVDGCQLNWHDSTAATEAPALSGYRIYRRTTGGWAQIATTTSEASEYLDTTASGTETIYYCVSDYDSAGIESPKSPQALFKPAKLEIQSVSAIPVTVTTGQSGIPVKVAISNTGYSPAQVDTISLKFKSPAVGSYSVTLSDSLPLALAGGETATLTFDVDILGGSEPELDTIDAVATGTNLQTNASLSAPLAQIKHTWLIRSPANLVVNSVTVPTTVYLNQKSVPVSVEILNDGEKNAAAYLDEVNLTFSNGTYTNISTTASLPITIYAGLTSTIDFTLDVSSTSATGSCLVDAEITFRDVNLLISSDNLDGAALPGTWDVVSGLMQTFKGPPMFPMYIVESTSFNQGATTVYARAQNLLPSSDYRFKWYNPSNTIIKESNPPATSDTAGVAADQLQLTTESPTGEWRVIAVKVGETSPAAETYFDVVTPASLSLELSLPQFVTVNQYFTATMTIINSGGAAIDGAYPGSLTTVIGNGGTATIASGPIPTSQTILGNSEGAFNWRIRPDSIGSYTLQGAGFGYDDNDALLLTAASQTSNMCTILDEPVLNVVAITEAYADVYKNQHGLAVQMQISNTGEAPVYVDAASLTFSAGTHSQQLASPTTLPFLLEGGDNATFTFTVNVGANSDTGAVSITGSFSAYDAYDSNYTYSASGGTAGSWTIGAYAGKLSANSIFSPEQYTYNRGQRMYVAFTGTTEGNDYRILFYNAESAGTLMASSSRLVAGAADVSLPYYDIPANASLAKWRAELWSSNPSENLLVKLAEQFFTVQAPGALTGSLTISPATSVDLGDNITVTMSLANNVANGSTIYPTTPSTPIVATTYTGLASLLSGPTPASATVNPGAPATFTWVFQTTVPTDTDSTFAMIATATGIDLNTAYVATPLTPTTVSCNTGASNDIPIYNYELAMSPDPINLGTLVSGQTYSAATLIENNGNTSLTALKWQKAYPTSENYDTVSYSYFSFSPTSGFSMAAETDKAGSFTLTLPYNQPVGTYSATMVIYNDTSNNGARDAEEPYDEFYVSFVASSCKVIAVTPDLIDLGAKASGSTAATQTFSVLSGGNINLDNLVFTQTAATFTHSVITVTPTTIGSLTTGEVFTASVSATIGADSAGTYIATWTVADTMGSYTADTFQVKFSIGEKTFTVTPSPYDFGYATPTFTLSEGSVTIENTGNLPLTKLHVQTSSLTSGENTIALSNIVFELPTSIAAGQTAMATFSVYVPPGTLPGEYTGTQYFFEDENNDGIHSIADNEASCTLEITLNVNSYGSIQIVPETVDIGELTNNEAKTKTFFYRNIGNTSLSKLRWEKSDLTYGAYTIPAASYTLTPANGFSAGPGTDSNATVTITINSPQANGFYAGTCWIYNDTDDGSDRDTSEPQDSFSLTCQVGGKVIEIVEAGPQSVNGTPYSLTEATTYNISNTGALILSKPRAILASALTDGTNTIATSAVIFTPSLFSYVNPGQTKSGTWAVQVPEGQVAGTYSGTIKVWEDTNDNGTPDISET